MPTKKRFFTKDRQRVGKKSGKPRGKYKKRGQEISLPQPLAIDKPQQKPQLPNISLNIPERLHQMQISLPTGIFLVFCAVIAVVSIWQLIGLRQKSSNLQYVVATRKQLSAQMQSWENIAAKYPGYRDAYFQAATLAYRLGDREKEKTYLAKTLQMDPNYEPAKKLESLQ